MPLLQIALDCLKIGEALRISSEVEEYVDILEVGTPLLKSEGLRTVEILKKVFIEKTIFAEQKQWMWVISRQKWLSMQGLIL